MHPVRTVKVKRTPNSSGVQCFSMVSRTLRKEGTPTASKLVLYGNHTLRAEMDTGPSEINAHFINWPHVARAAPRTPKLNVGLF